MVDVVAENTEGVARFAAGMPELQLQGSLRSKRSIGYFLGVNTPEETKGRRIVDGVIRLADKSALEYQSARVRMLSYLGAGLADDLYRAHDHFESCIHALHRGFNFLERLRGMGYRLPSGDSLVKRPRDWELLQEPTKKIVRDFRDLLEHVEKDIVADSIPEDQPASVHLGWERATIHDQSVEYTDLARWCMMLYEFALSLSDVTATVTPAEKGENDV